MQDIAYITEFWREKYLEEYIRPGGSKIKFVMSDAEDNRRACLRRFTADAETLGFRAVSLSAKEIWLHDFKDIYVAILERAGLRECIEACANVVIHELGFSPEEIPDGKNFAEHLAQNNAFDPLTRREMRAEINRLLLKNPRMDKNFAFCAAMMVGNALGYPVLEPGAEDTLLGWLTSRKGIRVGELRKLGLSPTRITKYNARHMLRSLVELIRSAGFSGLVVTVDDLETLVNTSPLEAIRYTKMRREDAYESIRELVDAIDTLRGLMFVFSFDRELMDNENAGLKSYQALWMRLQNEVKSEKINRFADIIDLDA